MSSRIQQCQHGKLITRRWVFSNKRLLCKTPFCSMCHASITWRYACPHMRKHDSAATNKNLLRNSLSSLSACHCDSMTQRQHSRLTTVSKLASPVSVCQHDKCEQDSLRTPQCDSQHVEHVGMSTHHHDRMSAHGDSTSTC